MKLIYIGIDPGSTTGVGLWKPGLKSLEVMQFASHCKAMLYLHDLLNQVDRSTVEFRIEDARLTTKNSRRLPPNARKDQIGKLQGVGYVKAYSKDWEAFCKELAVDYKLLPPSNTKYDAETFFKLTGVKTNPADSHSHSRDAGMRVFGI